MIVGLRWFGQLTDQKPILLEILPDDTLIYRGHDSQNTLELINMANTKLETHT